MHALYRLLATAQLTVSADATVKPSEWWTQLPAPDKKEYLEQHPASKYADQAIKEGEEKGHEAPSEELKTGSKERTAIAGTISKNAPVIASQIKKTFPKITHALGALKNLATGKPLDHHQKEVLHELGDLALHTAAGKMVPGSNSIHMLADIGMSAVKYGIEHYKKKQDANKDRDSVEAFVDAVAEGTAKADHAPVPDEHAAPGSKYRKALAAHFKSTSHHVTEVLNRSFPHIKPAGAALKNIVNKKPLDKEQKQALQSLGKQALMMSIATLPGGLAVHLTAGISASVVSYAVKKFRAPAGESAEKSLVGHFVEAIGEGLEHATISGHLFGHEGGHEGGHGE